MFDIKIINMSHFKLFFAQVSQVPLASINKIQHPELPSLIEKKNNPQNCSPRGGRGGINNLIKCDILVTYFTWMKSGDSKKKVVALHDHPN